MRLALRTGLAMLSLAALAAPPTEQAPASVSVMTYNLLYDSPAIEKSLDAIEKANPDIICLRELSTTFSSAFERRLATKFPHRALVPKKVGTWGLGIVSRFPITKPVVFEEKPHQLPAMEAWVQTPSGPTLVACLHLFPPMGKHRKSDGLFETMDQNAELRRKQAEQIVARYANLKAPLLVVGDMNETPDGKAMKTFEKAGLQRSCRCEEARCGATFTGATTMFPAIVEIDHILGRGVDFTAARVIREGGSDHFPVLATFAAPKP